MHNWTRIIFKILFGCQDAALSYPWMTIIYTINLSSACWLTFWYILKFYQRSFLSCFIAINVRIPTTRLRWTNIKNMYFVEIQSLTPVFFTETVNHSWFLLGWCCRLLWGICTKWLVFGNCADYFRTCSASISPYLHHEWGICCTPTHTASSQSPGL